MKKLEKIPELRSNPSEAWQHVQTLRNKINEVISVLNGEEEINSMTTSEKVASLKSKLVEAMDKSDMKAVAKLSKEITKLEK